MKLYKVGFWVYRWVFPHEYTPIVKHISQSELPWLFVGIELTNGKIIDKTDEAFDLINKGLPVTPTTININIDLDQIKRCFYLDAATLKEEEIPAEGITINDS